MAHSPIDSIAISRSRFNDDDKRQQFLFTACGQVDGTPIATYLIKSREEIPRYDLARTNPVLHLGEPPKVIEDAQDKYQDWVRDISTGSRDGTPHYIVDATPLGAIELALTFKEDERLRTILNEIRGG